MAAVYADLVSNSNFTNGTTGWWAGDPAMVTLAAPGTGAEATATTEAVNLWDAPFGQDGIVLRKGCTYTFSFTARASQPGTALRAQVGLGTDPWTVTLDKRVTLSAVDKHFYYSFVSELDTEKGQVSFQIGQGTSVTVHLTEVRLTCSTPREGFFVDADSNAAKWVRDYPKDPRVDKITRGLVRRPTAKWFGDWNKDVQADVDTYVSAAAAAGLLPILAVYNVFNRDNGGESHGGAKSAELYRTWVDAVAAGIGDRPALVIVEPDALAQIQGLRDDTARAERLGLIKYAAEALGKLPHVRAYLDGGNATWIKPQEMSARLAAAGVAATKGFAVGVSNFDATDISATYGTQVSQALAGLGVPGVRFVIDTSRNGNGAMDGAGQHVDYCNPGGRRLGVPSSIGVGGAEYLLWIKVPGDSDGMCGTAPDVPAGTFSPFLAEQLIDGR
ncbi:glycoside hydrolase family 6 protein [Streptomyces sp. NBC_00237]|uniref:glycoside hydrolase family 6 protein n=1 Tax=Streptomyces sp. NBC_00237 TaxID=2975687 RepID=UPI0022537A6D|nr:glycoside hydrolase family 6 protein [Streptomyces sp. NBC_00237]MCX5206737.1 glycoside hydrolase family 6 protein [Streptomyces sp. NBC_00237]